MNGITGDGYFQLGMTAACVIIGLALAVWRAREKKKQELIHLQHAAYNKYLKAKQPHIVANMKQMASFGMPADEAAFNLRNMGNCCPMCYKYQQLAEANFCGKCGRPFNA